MLKRSLLLSLAGFLLISVCNVCSAEPKAKNRLPKNSEWSRQGFQSPDDDAKTQVFYHWMNGHLSKEAITKDLESMKAVGLGGISLFNAAEGTPPGDAPYFGDAWWDAFIHTKKEVKRLGLQMRVMNCPGWATSGGPWNTPENAMKEVVWTEVHVEGGRPFSKQLATPKPVLGLERDMKRDPVINRRYYMPREALQGHYHDLAVLAFPTPQGEREGKPYQLEDWWAKAGFKKMKEYTRDTHPAPEGETVKIEGIVDLTDKVDAAGNLTWDVPKGNWTILSIGYQPTGRSTHPAPEGGKGLEVDRMSAEAVTIHWNHSVQPMLDAGEEGKARKAISSVLIDSYEAGHQNWTKGFEKKFQAHHGYDIRPYLLAIAGRIVESTDTTERFLWDYRKTIGDLINENYYGRFQTLAHKNGVNFACEGYGNYGNTDDFALGKYVDVPMNEFWGFRGDTHGCITKWAASTAHIYGKKIVGAEAFTGVPHKIFETCPRDIKAQGDWYFARGINRFVLHGYTHSPYRQEPGLSLGMYGAYFNRHNTWWKYSKPWFDYLARCQYMLQQGNPKSDILFYTGEDAPSSSIEQKKLSLSIPVGYDYDFCSRDILEQIKVRDKKIVLPNGQEYALLAVKKSESMRPEVLRTLKSLIEQGATVVAFKPTRVPGLSNVEGATKELKALTAQIWGPCDGKTVTKHTLGKGTVYCGDAIAEAAKDLNLPPDFQFELVRGENLGRTLLPGTGTEYIHRQTANTDVYFVSNQHEQPKVVKAKFRVGSKQPELWDPVTGNIAPAPEYRKLADGRMEVTLRLEEAGSVFVVFRDPLQKETAADYRPDPTPKTITFQKPWKVSFQGGGAPESIQLPKLIDLAKHDDSEVKHFSGTIIYQNTIDVKNLDNLGKAVLDLGQVEVAAEVFVNDRSVGILWKNPFRIDITNDLKVGTNQVRVEVANLWINRVLGDQSLPDDCEWTTQTGSTAPGMGLAKVPDWVVEGKASPTGKKAFVSWKWVHMKNKKPAPSGLIGPVSLKIYPKN